MSSRGLLQAGVLGLGVLAWFVAPAARAETFSTGPSAFCHVTDGAFTDCGGSQEWSDILALAGVGTSAGAIVYTDQSVAPPRLLLMYDLAMVPRAPISSSPMRPSVSYPRASSVSPLRSASDRSRSSFRFFSAQRCPRS